MRQREGIAWVGARKIIMSFFYLLRICFLEFVISYYINIGLNYGTSVVGFEFSRVWEL